MDRDAHILLLLLQLQQPTTLLREALHFWWDYSRLPRLFHSCSSNLRTRTWLISRPLFLSTADLVLLSPPWPNAAGPTTRPPDWDPITTNPILCPVVRPRLIRIPTSVHPFQQPIGLRPRLVVWHHLRCHPPAANAQCHPWILEPMAQRLGLDLSLVNAWLTCVWPLGGANRIFNEIPPLSVVPVLTKVPSEVVLKVLCLISISIRRRPLGVPPTGVRQVATVQTLSRESPRSFWISGSKLRQCPSLVIGPGIS